MRLQVNNRSSAEQYQKHGRRLIPVSLAIPGQLEQRLLSCKLSKYKDYGARKGYDIHPHREYFPDH